MNKPEILAPAGSLSKLKTAVLYGADAVYCGMKEFSLRTAASNFTFDELRQGVDFAHERGKKVYVATNIIPDNQEISVFENAVKAAVDAGADALIIADPGAFSIAQRYIDKIDIHISTQANNVNYEALNFWHRLGARRVVLARELSFEDIRLIREKVSPELELEMFVHGAMCISYSGRCLLSSYMASRDSNHGDCAHPCRWNYTLMEEKRPGEFFPVYEDEKGTYIFNSKDLCLIEHLHELCAMGINSFKIEGRVKNDYYVAAVTKAYRQALDSYLSNLQQYVFDPDLYKELCKVSHRFYFKGVNGPADGPNAQMYTSNTYIRKYDVVGIVESFSEDSGISLVRQRNKFYKGDLLEILPFRGPFLFHKADFLKDADGNDIESTPHADMLFQLKTDFPLEPGMVIRKQREE